CCGLAVGREGRGGGACCDGQGRLFLRVRDCIPCDSQCGNPFLVRQEFPTMTAGDVAVRFEEVAKSIGETDVLEDISFEVPRGTVFSILGRREAGKTTVLKLSIGLLKPD